MSFGPILHDFLFCDWIEARGLIAEELGQLRTELNAQIGTILAAVQRGDILVGNSVPQWGSLPIGANHRVLKSNGVDPSWGQVALATDVSGTLPVANGGTGLTTYTIGDLIYASATGTLSRLAAGPAGSVLTSNGAGVAPSWKPLPVTPIFFPEDNSEDSVAASSSSTTSSSAVATIWSVLTNGNAVSPALIFDSNGDVIMTTIP